MLNLNGLVWEENTESLIIFPVFWKSQLHFASYTFQRKCQDFKYQNCQVRLFVTIETCGSSFSIQFELSCFNHRQGSKGASLGQSFVQTSMLHTLFFKVNPSQPQSTLYSPIFTQVALMDSECVTQRFDAKFQQNVGVILRQFCRLQWVDSASNCTCYSEPILARLNRMNFKANGNNNQIQSYIWSLRELQPLMGLISQCKLLALHANE